MNASQTMWLLRLETLKIRRQKTAMMGVVVVLLLAVLAAVGFYLQRIKRAEKTFEGQLFTELMNGLTFSIMVLVPAIYMLLPIVIGIITANSLAGEFQNGQIRMVCSRPVSRWNVLLTKWMVMTLYACFLLLVLLGVSYALGSTMFGASGDVIIHARAALGHRGFHVLPEATAWRRMFAAYTLAGCSMFYITALFMMFSAMFRRMPTAAVVPLGIYFTSYILLNLPFMEKLRQFLPTRYLAVWRYFLMENIPWDRVFHDSAINAAYIIAFLLIGQFFVNSVDV